MKARCVISWATRIIFVSLLVFQVSINTATGRGGINLDLIRMPPGFKIDLYADNIPGARSLVMSPSGTLFVGTRKTGRIYAVLDRDSDHRAEELVVLVDGLNMPNGVAFRQGALYVAEVNRVIRFDAIEQRLDSPPEPVVVNDTFPRDRHHGWKYMAFGPDGRLYVPVGAPCNICESKDRRFATIMRMKPDGSELEIFVSGVRNSVGFDWHPETGDLWFTNNGRDWMGDDLPPDTLHHAPVKGLHFGYPYCHAGRIPDPKYGRKQACDSFTPPALELDPHVAPLGMTFYTGRMFPSRYRHQIFIAEHGSWNRSVAIGYRITMAVKEASKPLRYEIFAYGWLQGGKAWGRPVDLLVLKDGSLLVSDDRAGVVYRITYEPE